MDLESGYGGALADSMESQFHDLGSLEKDPRNGFPPAEETLQHSVTCRRRHCTCQEDCKRYMCIY